MNIGILTFHWATNYGAVLQCYALQCLLKTMGHNVEIINYKPRLFDDTIFSFIRCRKFCNLKSYLNERKKEKAVSSFRKLKLHQSKRLFNFREIQENISKYNVIISGSDQVLNASFLCNGEGKGIITPTYYLGFNFAGKKVGYALSFGTIDYPDKVKNIASNFMNDFNLVSVRERTGINIMNAMGRKDVVLVPDPTLLMNSDFYHELADECDIQSDDDFIYGFFIRHISERKKQINFIFSTQKLIWNNEDGDYTLQGWLSKIKKASFVITDSFHCMVMCLKLHTPFKVITELQGNIGMNDRFYTLLEKMDLENLIVCKDDIKEIVLNNAGSIDWRKIDNILNEYRNVGVEFLKRI